MSALNPKQGFTCVACRLVFPNAHLQKEHYVSEWHRYNAKRQVAGLPAISEEQFVAKVQDFQKASEDLKKKGETEKAYCKYCKKLFQSQNAHDNHLNSKRHKTNEASYVEEEPVKSEKVSSEEQNDVKEGTATKFVDGEASTESEEGWESTESDDDTELDDNKALSDTACLFCPAVSSSAEQNLGHMETHGFFIPDVNFCSDVPGLLKYLGLKVGAGHYCIRCTRNRFPDLNACQLHMRDKAHFTISLDGDNLMEYLDYYDYGELMTEDDDDDVAIDLGYTLVLPSGAKLGHRSLVRYYKQHLRTDEAQQKIEAGRLAMKSSIKQKALGWTGETGANAVQRARDFKFIKKIMQKQWMYKGIKSNKLFKSRGRDDQM